MCKCKKCNKEYTDSPDDDGFETGLCYRCFEDSLEDYEENKRQRIAERNEY